MSTVPAINPTDFDALADCISALQKMAGYELDPEVNEYMTDALERKEFLIAMLST